METAAAVGPPITLSMEYEDADGTAYTSTEVIYLTLTTETDLRLDSPVVPVSMEAITARDYHEPVQCRNSKSEKCDVQHRNGGYCS